MPDSRRRLLYKKFVWATPAKEYTAQAITAALFTFFCTFGKCDELWSDSGSDLMVEVVQKLSEWIRRVMSLLDRHESLVMKVPTSSFVSIFVPVSMICVFQRNDPIRLSSFWCCLRSTMGLIIPRLE